jgi:hypothetical protein
MFHSQDCCESVSLDDISGELADLVNSPITKAEEVTSNEPLVGATTTRASLGPSTTSQR